MNVNKRIQTILYDDQRFTDAELDLLHTPMLQRLYELKQLGLTDRVFIDASHSRLHHVIGVVEQADLIIQSISKNLSNERERSIVFSQNSTQTTSILAKDFAEDVTANLSVARLMALLHDLTHAPFGHTLEDEIQLFSQKHDEPERQAEAFLRLILQYLAWTELNFHDEKSTPEIPLPLPTQEIINDPFRSTPVENDDLIKMGRHWAKLINNVGDSTYPFQSISKSSIIELLITYYKAGTALLYLEAAHKSEPERKHIPESSYPFQILLGEILKHVSGISHSSHEFNPHKECYLLDVIGNTICADLLDYAKRDSISAGLKLDFDSKRIVENFTLVTQSTHSQRPTSHLPTDKKQHPFAGKVVRTAIKLFNHKLRLDVPGELLSLLQARYYIYERMLFHPTKCCAGAMLGTGLQLVGLRSLPKHLYFSGDNNFINEIIEASVMAATLLKDYLKNSKQGHNTDIGIVLEQVTQQLHQSINPGSFETTRQILKDLRPTKEVVQANLDSLETFRPHAAGASKIQKIIKQFENNVTISKLAILKKANTQEKAATAEMHQVLDLIFPEASDIIKMIESGIALLRRQGSRRYYKRLFRLLPDMKTSSTGAGSTKTTKEIASKFTNPLIRFHAEREIERRCKLPTGAVVIHCPPSKGPTKVARINVTTGTSDWKYHHLKEIGSLENTVFAEHQKAVDSLENMYRSIWRLQISISPPYTKYWRESEALIGQILAEVLNGPTASSTELIVNDEYMSKELQFALETHTKDNEISLPSKNSENLFSIPKKISDRNNVTKYWSRFLKPHRDMVPAEYQSNFNKATNRIMSRVQTNEQLRKLTKIVENYRLPIDSEATVYQNLDGAEMVTRIEEAFKDI